MTPPAGVTDFKTRFDREFIFGSGRETVRDLDISNAITDALLLFNASLWADAGEQKTAFLYLSAHCLATNLQAAGGVSDAPSNAGLDQPGAAGLIQSKSVGPVSVSYALPERLVNDPILSQFMRTAHGQKYLALLQPRLVGAALVLPGWRESDLE